MPLNGIFCQTLCAFQVLFVTKLYYLLFLEFQGGHICIASVALVLVLALGALFSHNLVTPTLKPIPYDAGLWFHAGLIMIQ